MKNSNQKFLIEAAINEEGPRPLLVEPQENGYRIYDNEVFLARIEPEEDGVWEVKEGNITRGIATAIGKVIARL